MALVGRRQSFALLLVVSLLTVLATLTGLLGSYAPASAQHTPGNSTQTSPIKHVVVLFLENQTFESVLGYWCDSPRQLDLANNVNRCDGTGMPQLVTESNGSATTPGTLPDVVPVVDHTTGAQVRAMDGGAMDGWWRNSGCHPPHYQCIAGARPDQIPNTTSLAHDFAISTATFSEQNSPSWFGHLTMTAATTDGFSGQNPFFLPNTPTANQGPGWGCDSGRVAMWSPNPATTPFQPEPSCIPTAQGTGAFGPTPVPDVPTIMDEMTNAGLPWSIYSEPVPQSEGTSPFSVTNGGYLWNPCASFADCHYTAQNNNVVQASQFTQDANSGNLPAFSLITPGGSKVFDSWHNGFSLTSGDNWVGQVAASIMNGPEWQSTALFITWDDCGCFYDQVPPPNNLNADGTPAGPRAPMIIVSPYAIPGYTDTTPTTFAGVLAYTEQNFGLAPLAQNDAAAYAYGNAFNYSQNPLHAPFHNVFRNPPKTDRLIPGQANQDS